MSGIKITFTGTETTVGDMTVENTGDEPVEIGVLKPQFFGAILPPEGAGCYEVTVAVPAGETKTEKGVWNGTAWVKP